MLPTPESIEQTISAALPCHHIEIKGDGQHFFATIVSQAFEGKRAIQRHQLIYQALGQRMEQEIHALSMKTFTVDEWQSQSGARIDG